MVWAADVNIEDTKVGMQFPCQRNVSKDHAKVVGHFSHVYRGGFCSPLAPTLDRKFPTSREKFTFPYIWQEIPHMYDMSYT